MNYADHEYIQLCKRILYTGVRKEDRTGTGTVSVFGHQMRFDLSEGFPLLTTKRLPMRVIFEELRWFLRGDTNIKYLIEQDVKIWNADAYRDYVERGGEYGYEEFMEVAKDGGWDLGPIYGKQWRSWDVYHEGGDFITQHSLDQIAQVLEEIRENPDSRRLIVSAWNPGEIEEMALPPCHILFQFYVADGKLSCQLYQRSGDVFLGVPFNIASYALLTIMIAKIVGLEPGEFVHTIGDAHIYLNHVTQVKEQIERQPRELPELELTRTVEDPADYEWSDVKLTGYNPHPVIYGKVSVG